jgi:hypothetical protein
MRAAESTAPGGMASSNGAIEHHTVRQVVPSCRPIPATEACSRRSWLIAHQPVRVLSNAHRRRSGLHHDPQAAPALDDLQDVEAVEPDEQITPVAVRGTGR